MSDIDPKKLKVAELRDELKARGLDTKGNKAQLVKRLEKSLRADAGMDTSQDLDASSQDVDLDASQEDDHPEAQGEEPEGQGAKEMEPEAEEAEEPEDLQQEQAPATQEEQPVEEESKTEAEPAVEAQPEEQPEAVQQEAAEPAVEQEEQPEAVQEQKEPEVVADEAKEAAPESQQDEAKKSHETEDQEDVDDEEAQDDEEDDMQGEFQVMDSVGGDSEAPEADQKDEDRRGEKRSHSRERHDRHHRHRSRSHSVDRRLPEPPEMENDDWLALTTVVLDRYNSDLNLRIGEDGFKANPITVEGFAFMWAGARANYGITKGKVAFEVKILDHLNVNHLPSDETNRHVVRIGYSTDSTTMQLGEEKFSYGYGGTGKASTDCKFVDFGQSFGEGDVIGAYLDMESEPHVITYAKNGEDLGQCFEIEGSTLEGKALFPHVLTKNCEFEVNFGQKEEPFFALKEGFVFINDVALEERTRGALPPEKKEECEMLMMCGLPGCGKTVWADKHATASPDKRFNILGTNNIIDKMKVMGLPRQRNYSGRWDVLIEKSSKCLNRLFEIAAKKKRNYILDQTNVYPNAQRRKMRPFEGFQRKAVVIVPTDEDFKSRIASREKEEGKEVPDTAINEMKANFQLPVQGPSFDEVEFVELDREEGQKLVETYNKEGRAALPPPDKRFRGDRYGSPRYGDRRGRDSRFQPRYDNRDRGRGGYGGRDNRGYHGGYDRRGDRYEGGRGGYNDRRNRGSYMGYTSSDRQRVQRYDDRRTSRYDNRSNNRNWSSNQGWNKGNQGWNQGSWGQQHGNWGQGNWGQQGWGQQGWGQGNWGGQWSGYSQNPSQSSQNWGQGYNYNYSNWPGYNQNQNWGQGYNYNYSQSK